MNKWKTKHFFSWALVILLLFSAIGSTKATAQTESVTIPPSVEILLTQKGQLQLADLLPALRELEKTNLATIRKTGWLHTIDERYNPFAEENTGTAMEGLTPQLSIEEAWTYVEDETGSLSKASYQVVKDEAGDTIQVAASDFEGLGGNLTLLEREVGLDPQAQPQSASSVPTVLESQLSSYISDLIRFEETSDTFEVWLEGEALHILKTYQVEGMDFEQYPEPVIAFRQDVAIDLASGNYLSRSTDALLQSGKSELWSSQRTLLLEAGVQMPEDVQESWENTLASIAEVKAKSSGSQEQYLTGSSVWCDTHATYQSTNSRGLDNIYCQASSATQNPIKVINVIGGKWVDCSQKCGGTVVSYGTTGSWPAYNASSYSRGRYIALYTCQTGLRRVSFTEAQHQFVHSLCGGSTGEFEILPTSSAHISD
ncbi:MAG: hypothetical protein ABFD17_01995 [Anaerolineaceae bacterium]